MGSDQAKSQVQPASAEGLYARAYSDSQQVEEDPRAPPCAPCAHSPAREIGGGGGPLFPEGSPGGGPGKVLSSSKCRWCSPLTISLANIFDRRFFVEA
jgi:hypothetical protein